MTTAHDPYNTLTPVQRRFVTVLHARQDWVNTADAATAAGVGVPHANRILNELVDQGTITRARADRVNRGKPAYKWRCCA